MLPAQAASLPSTRVPGLPREATAVSAGAWQLHPSGGVGAHADYTVRLNLSMKVLDFVQLGGAFFDDRQNRLRTVVGESVGLFCTVGSTI